MKNVSLKFGFMIASVVLAAMLAGTWLTKNYWRNDSRAVMLPDPVLTLFPEPKSLTAFTLTDHNNQVFDLSRLKGKWSFLFFGFTHCPDVCPTTLVALARLHESIIRRPADAKDVQFIFVSVDPNRDTPGKLKEYVGYFDSDFLGVTGDDAQISNLAGQLGAAYQVAITPGTQNYPVNHTTAVFLLDPQGRYHAIFTPPHDAETIARRFKGVQALETGNAI